jgi:hypothetical protein
LTNNEYIYDILKNGINDDFTVIDTYNNLEELQKNTDTAFINLDSEKIINLTSEYGLKRQEVDLTFEIYIGIKTAKDIDKTGLLRVAVNTVIEKVKKKIFSLNKNYNQTNSTLNIAINDIYLTEIHKSLDTANNFGLVYFIGNINYYEGI